MIGTVFYLNGNTAVAHADQTVNTTNVNKNEQTTSVNTGSQLSNNAKTQNVMPNNKPVANPIVTSAQAPKTNETSFNENKSQVYSGQKIFFDFKTNEAKAGDVYKIVIPEKDDNLDASGTYKVEPG